VRLANSSKYEFVEVGVIILSVGSAANEAPPAKLPPNCLFMRFVGEVNEFVSANLRRKADIRLDARTKLRPTMRLSLANLTAMTALSTQTI
jgi:hypothetical protein